MRTRSTRSRAPRSRQDLRLASAVVRRPDFAKVWSRHGEDLSDMLREAALGALADAHVEPAQLGLRDRLQLRLGERE